MSICNFNSLLKRLTKSKTDSSTKKSGTRNGNRFLACHIEWMFKILRPWDVFWTDNLLFGGYLFPVTS